MLASLFPTPPRPETKLFPAFVANLPDLSGKTIAITGCTSGTGLVLAETCADRGARVVMLNRTSPRAEAALARVQARGDASWVPCDLQRFDAVREAAAQLRATVPDGLDVLCNNAGVMGLPDEATPDGFDVQMQANHLSHFLLTSAVWPLLAAAADARGEARVVNHSSGARKAPSAPLQARYLQRNGGDLGGDGWPGMSRWRRYQQSKLANLLFTYALHDRIAGARPAYAGRVKSVCAHPGPTDSGLQGKTAQAGGTRLLDRYVLWRTLRAAQSVEDGTMGIARACCAPDVESGDFYGPVGSGQGGPAERLPPERDAAAEALLWDESLAAVGIDSFFG
ncbi:MAG: SDR family NAD(P)-dependent oxidoreductase [Alphaproteobacteria bacterium]|nr:SDR family NAD(P)-dependent oxidoreductase [Alphaproteobacteria bacterium]